MGVLVFDFLFGVGKGDGPFASTTPGHPAADLLDGRGVCGQGLLFKVEGFYLQRQ